MGIFTRDLVPTHSEGLPLQVPLAHNVPVALTLHTGNTPTVNLPYPMVMVDPSDRMTWPWPIEFGTGSGSAASAPSPFKQDGM